jgi:AraC-like DNA-binding protein
MIDQISKRLFTSNLISVGTFRCPTHFPYFANTGPINGYMLVFPRTSVIITHEGRQPVVADPNVVMLYNKGQVYWRGQLSPRGDLCDWFSFNLETVLDTIRPFYPPVEEMEKRPFNHTHFPSTPQAYLLQRLVVKHLLENDEPDQLYIEESMLTVLRQIIKNGYGAQSSSTNRAQPTHNPAHAELAHEVKRIVASSYRQKLSLETIASQVYSSPYHLCRIFQQQTGLTIHKYLNQVRLRTSLEYLTEASTDLTQLGLRLGYSSHSHFSQAFKQSFNTTPSAVRDHLTTSRLRQMSNFLIA